ncbi:MAG: hypothetical protein VX924_00450 [Candidatus Neomarinimicrobiota bacterium]|nr:hypothetical protein [Candidatus Neomarinimicrobiota bacterium]MEC7853813.1 hypothetical protein [Candidatus Neomarinimicrobiota bacterium]|tara:strand:+ start:11968 stop:12339 length:372 start_codon:yes stop_codon:yes gene_type:complete
MPKNKPTTFKQRIEFIKSLEEFFVAYEPKFGEKIKVRRFLQGLKELRADQKDGMIQARLKRIKDTNIKKSDVTFLKSLDERTLNDYMENLKRKNHLPLIVRLMERVNPPKTKKIKKRNARILK